MTTVRGSKPGFAWVVLTAISAITFTRPSTAAVRFHADRLCDRLQINPRDGSVRYGESDIEINAAGFALFLRRAYCSSNTAEGLFGRGWACEFDRRLDAGQAGRAVVRDEWGESVVFAARGFSVRRAETGRPQWLHLEKNGALLRDFQGRFLSFDQEGRLDGVYNSAMTGITIRYANGRLASASDPYGRRIHFTTGESGRVTAARSSTGERRRYEYEQNRLARVLDADGVLAAYAYEPGGRLRSIELAAGETAEIAYDGYGRVARLGGPGVAARTVRYSTRNFPFPFRLTEISDARGNVMRYRYRDNPPECQITLPSGQTATIDYDRNRGLPSRIDLPERRRIVLQYNDAGYLTRLSLPGGADFAFAYTGRGNIRTWTRADGGTFEFEWSDRGQLRAVRGPGGQDERRFAFDGRGRLAWLAEGRNRAITFAYNTWGDLSSVAVHGTDASVLFDLDESGRFGRIAPPGRPTFQVIHGPGGRPETLTDSVGYRLAIARDRQGRLAGIEDAARHREQLERDHGGRPVRWRRPDGAEVLFAYDDEGNLTEVRSPEGNAYRFRYDERNLATSESVVGVEHRLQYDAFGSVVARRRKRGRGVRLAYGPLGRLTEITDEGRIVGRFQYSLDGRLLRMSGRDREYRFGSDKAGRPTRVAETRSRLWAEHVFDNAGRAVALRTPPGRWIREYDDRNRLTRLFLEGEDGYSTYVYENEAARLPARIQLPDDASVAYTYDAHGRPASIHAMLRTGQSVLAERYRYDGRGNLAAVDTTGRRIEYEYDPQNRLVAERRNGHVYARLHYGRDGRLLKIAGEEGDREFLYDGDGRLLRSSKAQFDHDLDGNLAGRRTVAGPTRYAFDALGRLVGVTLPSGLVITHEFAPNGWPIGRRARGREIVRFFLGGMPLYAAADGETQQQWYVADPFRGWILGTSGEPRSELPLRDAVGRLKAVVQGGGNTARLIPWGLLGRRAQSDGPFFFDPLDPAALSFDDEANLSGAYDPAAGLSLAARPLRESLAPYAGSSAPPPWPSWATRTDTSPESALFEELAAACAAGQYAPDEGMILRYLLASATSPGWPDAGADETFDGVLEGHSFRKPADIARRITETVLHDGSGGLSPSVFQPHVGVPASWLGVGRYRVLCPTLSILPPVILESDVVGETVWREDPAFTGADNALHGWMARLVARAADRAGVRTADDGCLRLLGELLEIARWTMPAAEMEPSDTWPPRPETDSATGPQADRIARRDRFLEALDHTP